MNSIVILHDCRLFANCATLEHISLNSNPLLTATDIAQLLHASSQTQCSHLVSVSALGCGVEAPLTQHVLIDAIKEKINHSYPLSGVHLSVKCLQQVRDEADVLSLAFHFIWLLFSMLRD